MRLLAYILLLPGFALAAESAPYTSQVLVDRLKEVVTESFAKEGRPSPSCEYKVLDEDLEKRLAVVQLVCQGSPNMCTFALEEDGFSILTCVPVKEI